MMDKLDEQFSKLKEYSKKLELKKLNQRIYKLKLSEDYLKKLTQENLIYIHVKLHNSLAYKKPFADVKEIKKAHDVLVKFMKNHKFIDKLDEDIENQGKL